MQADRKRAVRNDRLRRARIERNLTQAEVAEQVGASELSVSRWELGAQAPLPYHREKLCRLYGKSPAELGFLAGAEPAEPAATPSAAGEERARRDLLAQVRRYWIDTELQAATDALPRLTPGLAERPDAVDDPVRVRPRPRAAGAGRGLAPAAAIGDVYRRLGQQLLILGAPGAGKTTLLLRLASELLGGPDGAVREPMPVVFHMASWASERKPLAAWLVDELYRRYGVARRIGQRWVRDDQVLPLLDGLDEVAERHRAACVDAINAFRSDHGQLPMVVCCRTAWYESLSARLALRGAVEILPLTPAEVQRCLVEGGERLAGLRALVAADDQLLELLTTPVFLTIAALTYRDRPPGDHPERPSLAERRRRLLRDYVEARLGRQAGAGQRYPRDRTLAWLGWLARTLRAHEQSVLYLDWMQPSWLPSAARRRLVTLGVTAFIALAVGLLVGGNWAANWWALGPAPAVPIGVTAGLLVATYHAVLAHESRIVPAEELRWSWSALRSLPRWLGFGLAAGIVAGLVFGLVLGVVLGLRPDVLSGPRSAGAPPPAGAISLRDGLVTGVVSGVVNGGILCVLICLTVGLLTGLRARPPVTDMSPGGSVASSGRTAIAGGVVGACVFGLGFALVYGLGTSWTGPLVHQAAEKLHLGGVYWPVAAPNDIAVAVLLGGSVAGLQRGGGAYLRHRVLLWLLALDGHAPDDYAAFLEHAARLILLQRRGGGYEFVHRVLLDELADAGGPATGVGVPPPPH